MAILPSFNDINYFLEVAETKNISRAAERLGITQPSLSSAIKRLEDSLGSNLLIRSRSGVQLTKAGTELQQKGRMLLLNWEQLKSDINKREHAVTGEYIIGCHPSVALYSLSKSLPKLLNDYPELNIKLEHDLSRKITEGIISYQIDFGIVVNPVKHPDLIIKELCTDVVTFWSRKNPTSVQKTGEQLVLICDLNLQQSQKVLADFEKQKVHFKRILHSTSLEVITDLVGHGAGIGIIPTRVATRDKALQLVPFHPKAPVFKDRICLAYRADQPRSKSREVITDAIRSAFVV